jgi:DNA-binding MarR family transcriptional regulator
VSNESAMRRPERLPGALDAHQSLVLFKLAGWFQSQVDEALRPAGFKTRHYTTLSVLRHKGPWSQRAVAEKLRIDTATMVAVINDLEHEGLVERHRDPEDKRNYRVRVTDAGVRWLEDVELSIGVVEDAVLTPLSSDERATLLRLTNALFLPET